MSLSEKDRQGHFETRAIHAGQEPDPTTGAIMTPVYLTSTYVQESPGKHKGYEYSRTHNPTRKALEVNLASLEGGRFGLAFASGCAASTTVLALLKAGDHVVCSDDVYGGTFRLFDKVVRHFGVEFSFVDMTSEEKIREALKPNTRMVWIETPTNPMMKLVDIEAVSKICKEAAGHGAKAGSGASKSGGASSAGTSSRRGTDDTGSSESWLPAGKILVAVDNTFMSPYFQQPLKLGADIVCHSTTKFLNGHSDVVGGAVVVNDQALSDRLHFLQNSMGTQQATFDSYLVLRSTKTLAVRMRAHQENAMRVAQYLEDHKKVERVLYPGLRSHPQHELAQRQMSGFGGMITFIVKGGLPAARAFLENVKIFSLAESLGGVESLIEHPAIMTHASVPPEQRKVLGIDDGLIRLSVGIEHIDDLLQDLERGFATVR